MDANTTRETQVVFSDDGKRLVAGGPRSVRIWGLSGADEQLTLTGHRLGVPGLAFNADGTLLASAGKDHTVRLSDVLTGEQVWTLSDFRGPPHTVAFSSDGRMLATGAWRGTVQIWDAQSRQRLAELDCGLLDVVAFSPDGRYFAAGGTKGTALWQIQLDSGKEGVSPKLSMRESAHLTTGARARSALQPRQPAACLGGTWPTRTCCARMEPRSG